MSSELPRAYSDAVLDHFRQPRNVGLVENANGISRVGDPTCGDVLEVSIRVDGVVLTDVKFRCRGCPAAIACASAMTELATGLDLNQASDLTDEDVEDALGGLPAEKRHCSNLAADALHEAVVNHLARCAGDPDSVCDTAS